MATPQLETQPAPVAAPVPSVAPSGPETIGQTLTRPAGPLPMWAWFAIGVLLLFLYLRYRSNQQASTQTTTQGMGAGTGTNTALTSNLVGVNEAVPSLAGTYQVTVQPGGGAQSINTTTTPNSNQGLANPSPPADTLYGTNAAPQTPQATQMTTPQTAPATPATSGG